MLGFHPVLLVLVVLHEVVDRSDDDVDGKFKRVQDLDHFDQGLLGRDFSGEIFLFEPDEQDLLDQLIGKSEGDGFQELNDFSMRIIVALGDVLFEGSMMAVGAVLMA